jgi:heme exporter protein D
VNIPKASLTKVNQTENDNRITFATFVYIITAISIVLVVVGAVASFRELLGVRKESRDRRESRLKSIFVSFL